MVFSITSPHLARVQAGMERVNIDLVIRDSAVVIADRLVQPLQQAATAAGASKKLVATIRVHDGHLNDLVMRDRGHFGDVIVGVDGASPVADEAETLEWGSLETGPRAWVRTTAARNAAQVHRMWSDEMTRELDRRIGA
jgi:hypothetical protein